MICWYYFRVICIVGVLLSLFDLVQSGRRPRVSITKSQIEKQEIDLNKPTPELDEAVTTEPEKPAYKYNKNSLSRKPERQKIYKQRWRAKIQQDPERLKRMREVHTATTQRWLGSLTEEQKAIKKVEANLRARKNRLKRKQMKQGQIDSQNDHQ